jgi:hypothetical protein
VREPSGERVRREARSPVEPQAGQGTYAQRFAFLGKAPTRKAAPVFRQQQKRGRIVVVSACRVSTPEQYELGGVRV